MFGAEGFCQASFACRGGRRCLVCMILLKWAAQCLTNSLQLIAIASAGLADPIMELKTDPRRPGKGAIHGLRRQVRDVFAWQHETSQQCGDHMALNRLILDVPINRRSRMTYGASPRRRLIPSSLESIEERFPYAAVEPLNFL